MCECIADCQKAAAADAKRAEDEAKEAESEAVDWDQGAKSGVSKKEVAEQRKAEAAKKKAERDALLDEETSKLPSKPIGAKKAGPKAAASRNGIDRALGETTTTLSATNIDDAIGALELSNRSTASAASDIDRHPERRFKAALLAYEERRLPELREEHRGLRLQQYKELIFKEFQKSDQNPKNQV